MWKLSWKLDVIWIFSVCLSVWNGCFSSDATNMKYTTREQLRHNVIQEGINHIVNMAVILDKVT